MEPTELEKNLTELEEKIERVRALYEQYFVGIEKLEPQIPRKDVDRAIVILRKEQIRNTAMRFKFQTLIQRYNTMQQHWARITREIENGTFKRDLLKAAARFGVDDALTAVGRKHAARLRNAVDKRAAKQGKRGGEEEFYEELSSSDLEVADDGDFDDDAPTPPPQRVQRPVYELSDEPDPNAYQAAIAAAEAEATYVPEGPSGQRGGYPGYGGAPLRADHGHAAQAAAPSFHVPDPLAGIDSSPPPSMGAPASAAAVPPGEPAPKKKGGLRWGGGGVRQANPEALKRIASLAGATPDVLDAMTAPKRELSPTAEQPPGGRKPLLSSPIDLGLPDETVAADEPRKPARAADSARKPLLSSPLDLDLGLAPSEPPPPLKPEPAKPEPARPAPAKPEPAKPEPARLGLKPPSPTGPLRPGGAPRAEETSDASPPSDAAPRREGIASPGASRAHLRPPPSDGGARPGAGAKREFGDLNDGRLREIYGQYVQTRRERNESTAGITFEKLADSLKSQADKLRDKHGKRVDYEIVVKDGKTLIKPIVK